MKLGLIGRKLGMTQRFQTNGSVVPVTVVELGPCPVVQIKTKEKDGYEALQLGYGDPKRRHMSKPRTGHFKKSDLDNMGYLKEFRIPGINEYTVGDVLTVEIFSVGEVIDVSGTSKGKGFSGVMKRYNFKGGSRSHGTHRRHRTGGAIGASAHPGRIFKGKRMAGRMGGENVTVQNLTILEINKDNNTVLIKGAVPGCKGSIIFVKKGIKTDKT